MTRKFVGIGFGAIQSGLFLLEAVKSGNFDRLVVAEVLPAVVAAIRGAGGCCWVNVAHRDGLRAEKLAGLEIFDPAIESDAESLVAAIVDADEIAVALPSVEFYERGSPCPAELLARGFAAKIGQRNPRPAVVYAAENHNRAAELLHEAVGNRLDSTTRTKLDASVQFVNTMIGKMSGVVTDPQQLRSDGLMPLVDGGDRAILVEEFNRILISRISLDGLERGFTVFQEKDELLPFEEAKLYGHNAAHALLGYLANRRGMTFMHEAAQTDLVPLVMTAFLEESGAALCQRHAGVDPLFTKDGWREYVRDLMARMVNPYLRDRVERVIRDPRRKLGWDDRLVGTMRIALENAIEPVRFALGAAAAVEMLMLDNPGKSLGTLLAEIWGPAAEPASVRHAIVERIEQACSRLSPP